MLPVCQLRGHLHSSVSPSDHATKPHLGRDGLVELDARAVRVVHEILGRHSHEGKRRSFGAFTAATHTFSPFVKCETT